MKKFEEWIFEGTGEDIVVPNEELALHRPRELMPKIADMKSLVDDLGNNRIKYNVGMMDPQTLKPGQNGYDINKVLAIQKATNPTLDAPLIVSRDNYVVDGHHRWLAAANNSKSPIMVTQVDMDFHDLIEFLNHLQYPTNQKVE